jgi:hypothetical protein
MFLVAHGCSQEWLLQIVAVAAAVNDHVNDHVNDCD